jgi:serine/threonine protein phosphatase PrpC
MKFNIAAFTHKGNGTYEMNEDRVLINGTVLSDGELILPLQDQCICFVSDGVGGTQGGLYAAEYILHQLKDIDENRYCDIIELLYAINRDLIDTTNNNPRLKGCACTLSGIIAKPDFVDFYHIGDSEIWLLRNDMLIKITKDEVLHEENSKSPITNYFGGDENKMKIDTDWIKPEILPNDIFLIASDGLFKSLEVKLVKPILSSEKNVSEKIQKLKDNCLTLGSEDNVSAILILVSESSE